MKMASVDIQSAVDLINTTADNHDNNVDFNALTNAFRYLRNLCGTNSEFQNEIAEKLNSRLSKILLGILTTENVSEEQILCLRIGLQLLGNLVVNNKNNQKKIWLTCEDVLEGCLKFNDTKVQNFCAMILYNIFLGNPEFIDQLKHPLQDLYCFTLNESTSEFAVFTLEVFVLKSNYLMKFYDELKPENRLIILEVIKNLITGQNVQIFQSNVIEFLSKQFTTKSDLILKTCENYANTLDPVEVVKLLDLIVAFSSDDKQCYLKIIQSETSLLINCVQLLKNIHSISKQSGNDFSMITKISEISKVENSNTIQEHPVFGFKCSLIRLIGNFCWKNVNNQNLIRELECIPVLLDCCNIDARNPFIIQWCILAIRNVCEKNQENQQVIGSLSKEGKIDAARLLEIGITLNADDDDNVLCIAPLK